MKRREAANPNFLMFGKMIIKTQQIMLVIVELDSNGVSICSPM